MSRRPATQTVRRYLGIMLLAFGCASEPPRPEAGKQGSSRPGAPAAVANSVTVVATAPAVSPPAPDSAGPWIEPTDTGPAIHLPPVLERALTRGFPNFRPWLWAAYPNKVRARYKGNSRDGIRAVVGDFNGDGQLDVAIDGWDTRIAESGSPLKPNVTILALLTSGDSALAVGVTNGSLAPGDTVGVPRARWLRLVPAKSYRAALVNDAIGVPDLSRNRQLFPYQVYLWYTRVGRPRFVQWSDGE